VTKDISEVNVARLRLTTFSVLLSIYQQITSQNIIHGAGLFVWATDMAGNMHISEGCIVQMQLIMATSAAATTAYIDSDMQ